MATRIDVPLLREQLHRVLLEVEAQHGSHVELDADHYWLVESAAALDLNRAPDLAVGQLSDDAAQLREMASRASDELLLWHDLKHLVGLLDALAAVDSPRD